MIKPVIEKLKRMHDNWFTEDAFWVYFIVRFIANAAFLVSGVIILGVLLYCIGVTFFNTELFNLITHLSQHDRLRSG
jgi:hypothetical protein